MTTTEREAIASEIVERLISKSAAIKATIRRAISGGVWLSGEEAADRLGVSPRKIKELRESGRLKGGLIPGMAQFRYHVRDVDACVVLPGRVAR